MFGDESRVQCYKEQYCRGILNVRYISKSKLEVVKQEMARMNINILRISELKWTRIGEFNSDDHLYLLLWARIPWKKWSSPYSQQKNLKCSNWVQSQKQQIDLSSFPRQTIKYHSNQSLGPNHYC